VGYAGVTSQRRNAKALKEALEDEALEKRKKGIVGAATKKNPTCGHAA